MSLANTPALPANFVECNGQTLNDPGSPYNGVVLPDLNGSFLRGSSASGGTGGSVAHNHSAVTGTSGSVSMVDNSVPASPVSSASHSHNVTVSSSQHLPPYYNVVWIIRIK